MAAGRRKVKHMNTIMDIVRKHEEWRRGGINLIASENSLSKPVREALASDLAGRYHAIWYGGAEHAREVIARTEELARMTYDAEHAFVTSLAGNMCDLTAMFAFSEPGDEVAILPFSAGGYPLGLEKFQRKRLSLPVHEGTFNMDLERAKAMLEEHQPSLTFLGCSYIVFPHPIKEIKDCVSKWGGTCVFDGSHVLGLIASGVFQDPLGEGADVLLGSTHKSLYGPQGGLLLTNSKEHAEGISKYLDLDLDAGFGLVDNPHMNRIAALGAALEELLDDEGYGQRVVHNSKTMAKALDEAGVPVKFKDQGYTESHQLFLDLDPKSAEELCHKLEKVSVFMDIEGRIGTAEATHVGMGKKDIEAIASIIAEVYKKGPSQELERQARALSRQLE